MSANESSVGRENVWEYPRPPAIERTNQHLRVVYTPPGESKEQEVVLADTKEAYRILETSHPPTFYFPPSSVNFKHLTAVEPAYKRSFCEWKGVATYFDFTPPSSPQDTVKARIWTYPSPTGTSGKYSAIKEYLAFYVGPWKCYVDGEEATPQPGGMYGGWMISKVDGGKRGVKGGPGTWGW